MHESQRIEPHALKDGSATARRGIFATAGAIAAAFLASLCCIGPLIFVAFGIGAGLASTFEPLRPVFTVLTIGLLALGFYAVYGRKSATAGSASKGASDEATSCGPDGTCQVPRSRTRDKVILWTATVVAILLLAFPQWSKIFV